MQRLHIIVLCDFVSPIISASKAQPSQHRPLGRATITHKTTLISTVCRISFSIICFWLPLRFYFIWRADLLWLPRHCPTPGTQASAPRCAPAQPHNDCIPTNCCGQQLYSVASLCLMLIIHTASQNVSPVHQASCKRQVAWNEEAKQQYGRSIFSPASLSSEPYLLCRRAIEQGTSGIRLASSQQKRGKRLILKPLASVFPTSFSLQYPNTNSDNAISHSQELSTTPSHTNITMSDVKTFRDEL